MTSIPDPFRARPNIAWSDAVYSRPGFWHRRAVALAARNQPQVWLDMRAGASEGSASSTVSRLKRKPSICFQPAGTFEFRTERRDDGYAIQVRYIGGPP